MQLLLFCSFFFLFPTYFTKVHTTDEEAPVESALSESQQLYRDMELEEMVNYTAFEQALAGYNQIEHRKGVMTLIDFSKPSTEKRLYVFDMKARKLLFVSYVSHGKNSGGTFARYFSNKRGSHKSSLGFYVTRNTYIGRNGYSLVLDGLEKGINDRAKERAIVIHGASYSDASVISSTGRLGRSMGCPALPKAVNKPIIDTIKEGSVLYIYANDPGYVQKSSFLSSRA